MANNISSNIAFAVDEGIAFVSINRVDKHNAMNSALLDELYELFLQIDELQDVRVVVLSGMGSNKAFIAGADLEEIAARQNFEFRDYYYKFVKIANCIMDLEKPVIAAVKGYAFGGGCLLVLACDLVYATPNAKFGQQEINYGFMGSAGMLPRLVGKHKAAEIVMLGDTFDAEEAYRIGIVNRVVDEEMLDTVVRDACEKLCSKSPHALRMIKKSIRVALETGLSVANLYETEVATLCGNTPESREALKPFTK